MALLLLGYGLRRLKLGVDFTDEGAYVAWPLRMLFGEKPFVSELGTLLRPLVAYLYLVFKFHPAITLYELRLLGWTVHVLSYCLLAAYLFRLSRAPLLSPLVACVPFFVCHIFGLAAPSYNILSGDFLLVALCLRGLASAEGAGRPYALQVASGLALFLATLAHPALGVVGAALLIGEAGPGRLLQNLFRRQPSPANVGGITFAACWLTFVIYLVAIGAHTVWYERITLFQSFTVTSINVSPVRFYLRLATFPFVYSRIALLVSLAALALAGSLFFFARAGEAGRAARSAAILALLLLVSLVYHFSYDPDHLPISFVQAALILLAVHGLGLTGPLLPVAPGVRWLLALAGLGAVVYATVTFYFSPPRSWMSGMLALPFPFATGLTLLLGAEAGRRQALFRVLGAATLVLAVACVAREHYRSIYRDAPPEELTATFRVPKLRHIRSTAERVEAVDALYDHLQPKLARGEPLLVFDDCPMLYYLFDAMPAYGLTWATRYTQSPAALRQLDRELNAKPLPRYAIRTLIDVSVPVWHTARRTAYDNYPLNDTLVGRYELEATIFPFEIWRLKPAAPREKTSPTPPGR